MALIDNREVHVSSDSSSSSTALCFAPERFDADVHLRQFDESFVEFYVHDDDADLSGPTVALNSHSARQLAAELLNRADRIDAIAAARTTR